RGLHEITAERPVDDLAALDLATPAGVAVDGECHPVRVRWGDLAGQAGYGVIGPLEAGLDRPEVASQERDGSPDELVVDGPWQPLPGAIRTPPARRRIRVVQQP